MIKQYHMDLSSYSIDTFKVSLSKRKMIPSRVMLKEKLEVRMATLKECGIKNIKELISTLKTPKAIELFAQESGLSKEYLTLLKREAASLLPNPIPLSKFPDVDLSVVGKLEAAGIKHSKHLFTKLQESDCQTVASTLGVSAEAVSELYALADLGRLYGVGPVFARIIYDMGVHSIADFITYTGEELIGIYEKKTGKKADFTLSDINFSLEMAQQLQ